MRQMMRVTMSWMVLWVAVFWKMHRRRRFKFVGGIVKGSCGAEQGTV